MDHGAVASVQAVGKGHRISFEDQAGGALRCPMGRFCDAGPRAAENRRRTPQTGPLGAVLHSSFGQRWYLCSPWRSALHARSWRSLGARRPLSTHGRPSCLKRHCREANHHSPDHHPRFRRPRTPTNARGSGCCSERRQATPVVLAPRLDVLEPARGHRTHVHAPPELPCLRRRVRHGWPPIARSPSPCSFAGLRITPRRAPTDQLPFDPPLRRQLS